MKLSPALVICMFGLLLGGGYLYEKYSSSSPEPTFTRLPNKTSGVQPNASPSASRSAAASENSSQSPNNAATQIEQDHASISRLRTETSAPTAPGSNVRADAGNANTLEERKKLSASFASDYISGMYSDEKLKQPVQEMASIMHRRYDGEARDDSWGLGAQSSIENYISSSLGGLGIDVTNVGCKTTTCEIVGVIPEGNSVAADSLQQNWDTMTLQMNSQPWWRQYQFGQPQHEIAVGPNGSMILFLYLVRQQ